jgi:hypothetical protein
VTVTFVRLVQITLCEVVLFGLLKEGQIQMPTKVNLELIIVWFCVGFFVGAGWAVATWLVSRILGLTHL